MILLKRFQKIFFTGTLVVGVILVAGVSYTYADHGSCSGANYVSCVTGGTWQQVAGGNYINDPTPGGMCSCGGCVCGSASAAFQLFGYDFPKGTSASGGSGSSFSPYLSGYTGSGLTTSGLTSGSIKTPPKTVITNTITTKPPAAGGTKGTDTHPKNTDTIIDTSYSFYEGFNTVWDMGPQAEYDAATQQAKFDAQHAIGQTSSVSQIYLGVYPLSRQLGQGAPAPATPQTPAKPPTTNSIKLTDQQVRDTYYAGGALLPTASTFTYKPANTLSQSVGYHTDPNDLIGPAAQTQKYPAPYDSPFTDKSKPVY
jgi:hypothetical protein